MLSEIVKAVSNLLLIIISAALTTILVQFYLSRHLEKRNLRKSFALAFRADTERMISWCVECIDLYLVTLINIYAKEALRVTHVDKVKFPAIDFAVDKQHLLTMTDVVTDTFVSVSCIEQINDKMTQLNLLLSTTDSGTNINSLDEIHRILRYRTVDYCKLLIAVVSLNTWAKKVVGKDGAEEGAYTKEASENTLPVKRLEAQVKEISKVWSPNNPKVITKLMETRELLYGIFESRRKESEETESIRKNLGMLE